MVGSTAGGWSGRATVRPVIESLRAWPARRWVTAGLAALAVTMLIGLPTDVIPNPLFGRPVPVTGWSYPVLAVTAALAGMLIATYVRDPAFPQRVDGPTRVGGLGGVLGFFAVGCPVCNKLVVFALGATGARRWFEPVQPLLAVASILLLGLALRSRLRAAVACPI